jgi:hypothetical protein
VQEAEPETWVILIELTSDVMAEEQRKDETLKTIMEVLLRSEPMPSWMEMKSETHDTRALWVQFKSLKIRDNLLQRMFYSPDGKLIHLQVLMPTSFRQPFLRSLNKTDGNWATSHLGVKKTLFHVSQRAYWVN